MTVIIDASQKTVAASLFYDSVQLSAEVLKTANDSGWVENMDFLMPAIPLAGNLLKHACVSGLRFIAAVKW